LKGEGKRDGGKGGLKTGAMTDVIDMLFIHVPKFSSYYKPYGEYMTINLLPMGTWALADLTAQHGYKTEVLHLGLEWIERGTFSPLNYLKGRDVKVMAIPLHWHQQSYDVMRVGDEIKREKPGTYIVLGGYTASFFHQEILSSFPQVDAVIRGDAERIGRKSLTSAGGKPRRSGKTPSHLSLPKRI
jgi:radical SAM superfamily enzyme YgiQ (UPF0313 family)